MVAEVIGGPRTWGGEIDEQGYRTYEVTHLVECDRLDGPATIMQAQGLPTVGSKWAFGNDLDEWAFCLPYMKVTIHEPKEGEPATVYRVDQKFTNKPMSRCQDNTIQDPLLEPYKISGSFVKYTKEVAFDRYGRLVASSSWEPLRGQQTEFDHNRPTVKIEQNTLYLGLSTIASLIDTVNAYPMWGLPARCVKLSNVSWERLMWGTCTFYYKRSLEFDIQYDTFDRLLTDMGTKVLNGRWKEDGTWEVTKIGEVTPDPNNPTHFIRATDGLGNPIQLMLDGYGKPLTNILNPTTAWLEYYPQADLITYLALPTSF